MSTCRTSVTWLVFLLSSLTSVLLLLFSRRMAAITTMEGGRSGPHQQCQHVVRHQL